MNELPKWADIALVPLISLIAAALISSVFIAAIGDSPLEAARLMVLGALGSGNGLGYTLYFATNFIFTGLAVAVAFQARIFNIGGEGQAMLGGLGVALICLYIPWPHWSLALSGASLGAALFGALWAFGPAWLEAKRGSHIVITTIMMNFVAAGLLNFLLIGPLKGEGMAPATAPFAPSTHLPTLFDLLAPIGLKFAEQAPVNITLFIALFAAFAVWVFIWNTRLGYEIRCFGHSPTAAKYAGISAVRMTVVVMMVSGALAGLMAINNVMGEAESLLMNAVEGAGFIGIAVALMGRNHPVGVVLAALLFGALYQGGAELSLTTSIPREMVVIIQALVIMFTGALSNMIRTPVEWLFALIRRSNRTEV